MFLIKCFVLGTVASQHPLKDKFVTKCKKITQEIDETELNIGYAFMTEDDMQAANFPQQPA